MLSARPRTRGRRPFRLFFAAAAAFAALLSATHQSRAQQWPEFAIWSFCSSDKCADGWNPQGGVIADPDGHLWGTTTFGGDNGAGAVFELTMPGSKVDEVVIHSFCGAPSKKLGCPDGALPVAGLAEGRFGFFFGTTIDGGQGGPRGTNGGGTVFEVLPGRLFKTLHEFCKAGPPCLNGSAPAYGLLANALGTAFYGTTTDGGFAAHAGAVFKVSSGGRVHGLYHFCSAANCKDGRTPSGGLISDPAGNLYGTTSAGGENGEGTVFRVTPAGNEKVLYSFCHLANCADGQQPAGRLAIDQTGNLYGTASGGGANGAGVVFEIDTGGNETVLYNFCTGGTPPCADGKAPASGVVMDLSGSNLYGTTAAGGTTDQGTVFSVPIGGGGETVIYSFCPTDEPVCGDGANPSGPLLVDGEGNLFGTTVWGGSNNTTNQVPGAVTVFEVVNPNPGT